MSSLLKKANGNVYVRVMSDGPEGAIKADWYIAVASGYGLVVKEEQNDLEEIFGVWATPSTAPVSA